jgi:hypothetical protein
MSRCVVQFWVFRFIALSITLGLTIPIPGSESQIHKSTFDSISSRMISSPADIQTLLPPEGRVRRLHMVRPDLMPYPLDIRTFC